MAWSILRWESRCATWVVSPLLCFFLSKIVLAGVSSVLKRRFVVTDSLGRLWEDKNFWDMIWTSFHAILNAKLIAGFTHKQPTVVVHGWALASLKCPWGTLYHVLVLQKQLTVTMQWLTIQCKMNMLPVNGRSIETYTMSSAVPCLSWQIGFQSPSGKQVVGPCASQQLSQFERKLHQPFQRNLGPKTPRFATKLKQCVDCPNQISASLSKMQQSNIYVYMYIYKWSIPAAKCTTRPLQQVTQLDGPCPEHELAKPTLSVPRASQRFCIEKHSISCSGYLIYLSTAQFVRGLAKYEIPTAPNIAPATQKDTPRSAQILRTAPATNTAHCACASTTVRGSSERDTMTWSWTCPPGTIPHSLLSLQLYPKA